jgi:SprB repeat
MLRFYAICLFTCIFLPFTGHSQCLPNFFDGFESGSYTPTWTIGAPATFTAAVTTTTPYAGTYRVELTGGASTHLTGLTTSIPAATPSTISWSVYPTGTGAANYMVLGNTSVSATNCIAFAYWQGGTNIRFVSSITSVYTCTPGSWYHIEMRNINWSAHTFDIWINNTLQATAFPFRSASVNDVSRIHLYNFNTAVGVWDNIQIGTGVSPILNFAPTNPLCNGSTDGAVDLSVTSGSPGYTYLWSTADTTQDLSGLNSGSYIVTVTDQLGCAVSDTVTLTDPPMLAASYTLTDPLCNGGSDGMIDLTPSGGTPGYGYLWSTGDTTEDVSALMAGSYLLTLSDLNGCSINDTVTIGEPSAISILDSLTMPSCFAGTNGIISVNPSGGTPGYSYLWSTGDTTSSVSGLSAGGYILTITDANGCAGNYSTNLSQPSAITVGDSTMNPACNGGSNGFIQLLPSGGTPGYTYVWSTSDTVDLIGGLGAGTYSAEITDANGCMANFSTTLTEPAAIVSSGVVVNQNGGNFGSVDLTVTGGTPGFNYAWNNGATTEDISNLTAATYTVTITDANGCQLVDTFVVSFISGVFSGNSFENITAFPNPFTSELNWTLDVPMSGSVDLYMMNLEGKEIAPVRSFALHSGTNSISIPTGDLAPGVYLFRIVGSGMNVSGKVVKME